jgi:hypothetical protein
VARIEDGRRNSNAEDRAQLWALYFQLRGLRRPPAFLAPIEEQLRQHLEAADLPVEAPGLRLVR